MKAIISHDIDHITVFEHLFKDIVIPKFMVRMHIELLKKKITPNEYVLRWMDFLKNKWQNIDELITFNDANNIPSSFFIAVNKGIGLNYSNAAALFWINHMKRRNCEIGIHGIDFDNLGSIEKEYNLFAVLSEAESFGMRMHYVRKTEETFKMLDLTGYRYDSTEFSFKNPYRINQMWEFPFQIMDGWMIENGKKWQSQDLNGSKDQTLRLIDKAHTHQLNYLGIDFHDRYFSNSFHTWLEWYVWLVDYLKKNKIEFINFDMAITELEKEQVI